MTTCGRLHIEKLVVPQLVRNSLHFVDHKGKCHVHKSSLLVPILSQIYPVITIPSCFFQICFNIIHPSMPMPSKSLFHAGFHPNTPYSFLSHVCRVFHLASSILSPWYYLEKNTNLETPHYANFSILLVPCPLMWETKFRIPT